MLMAGDEKGIRETKNDDENTRKERRDSEREEEICDLFYLFDRDRSGHISLDELSSVMVRFGGLSKPEIDFMLIQADIDGDGKVI